MRNIAGLVADLPAGVEQEGGFAAEHVDEVKQLFNRINPAVTLLHSEEFENGFDDAAEQGALPLRRDTFDEGLELRIGQGVGNELVVALKRVLELGTAVAQGIHANPNQFAELFNTGNRCALGRGRRVEQQVGGRRVDVLVQQNVHQTATVVAGEVDHNQIGLRHVRSGKADVVEVSQHEVGVANEVRKRSE